MEFALETVDIDYETTNIEHARGDYRTTGTVPVFVFVTDKFISRSILAKVKQNKGFLKLLKDSIIEGIRSMSDEDFERIKASINEHAQKCYRHDTFAMKLTYWNEPRTQQYPDNRFRLYYQLSHEGFQQEVQNKDDLIYAASKLSVRDIAMK